MNGKSAAFVALLLTWLLAACASPIVGAECSKGLVRCDGKCVDAENDPHNCGLCGHDCGRLECNRGLCGGTGSSSDGGFSRDDAGGIGVPTTLGGVGTPFLPDGGLTFPDPMVELSCEIGETACGSGCSDLLESQINCGDCGTRCPPMQFCSLGECKDLCDPSMMACAGGCTDAKASPNHCGKCGVSCVSGICEDGACADALPGHIVVIGHDFASGGTPTMRRLAGDALFLARGAPVRALVYRGTAIGASVSEINAAIDYVALDGRQWEQTEAIADDVPEQLRSADAFLIHAQQGSSTDAELTDLGRRWGLAMTQFLRRGGVVLMFETTSASNTGTYHLLEPSGLFVAKSRARIAVQNLDTVGIGFGAATHATRKYRCTGTSVHFVDVTSPGYILVEDKDGEAVVVQRILSE